MPVTTKKLSPGALLQAMRKKRSGGDNGGRKIEPEVLKQLRRAIKTATTSFQLMDYLSQATKLAQTEAITSGQFAGLLKLINGRQ